MDHMLQNISVATFWHFPEEILGYRLAALGETIASRVRLDTALSEGYSLLQSRVRVHRELKLSPHYVRLRSPDSRRSTHHCSQILVS